MNLGEVETIVYDVTISVFDRCKEGFLYLTKDEDCFIVSVPVINFSYTIKDESDYQRLLKDDKLIADRIVRENITKVVRLAVKEFE